MPQPPTVSNCAMPIPVLPPHGLLGGRAAVGAHDGVVGDLFTALITEHDGEILIKMPTLMRIFGFLRMPVRVNSYKFKKKISPPPPNFPRKISIISENSAGDVSARFARRRACHDSTVYVFCVMRW